MSQGTCGMCPLGCPVIEDRDICCLDCELQAGCGQACEGLFTEKLKDPKNCSYYNKAFNKESKEWE